MRNIKSFILKGVAGVVLFAGMSSCSDLLDANADEVLGPDQVYQNKFEADAAIRGIYGKLIDVAAQYVVLNELRADLMDVTTNADPYLIEIAHHKTITEGNEWADPRKFFALINSCNDVIKNLRIMRQTNKLTRDEFNQRYSDAMAVRCWTYLQVSLHFADPVTGGVPYITEPLNQVDDLSASSLARFNHLDLSTMIDTLTTAMENLPYKKKYTEDDLLLSIDGFDTELMYIDKEYLLGLLHLWNEDYYQAASYFKTVMERGVSGNDLFDLYKLPFDASATLNQATCRYNSGYTRYYENDINSAKNMWTYMFMEIQTPNYYNEWLWNMYYDIYSEPSPFVNLFSNMNGSYQVKPSRVAIANWNSQVQRNGFLGDFRGYFPSNYSLDGSYDIINGDTVILKHAARFMYGSESGAWYLWRAGGLHLHYCEAANRDGQNKIAYALMNNGIGANFNTRIDLGNSRYDYTNSHQTFLPFPYDFDARSTGVSDVPPNLRQPWFRNNGVRNRVSLANRTVTAANQSDSTLVIESQILEERGLELAFEGERWADLVRISLHQNDPSILASRVQAKLASVGVSADYDLTIQKNWFLPLK